MKHNIVDIVHLLTLVPHQPEQLSARRMSKSKSTHSTNSYNAQLFPRNQYPGPKPVRQSTQKLIKKKNIVYEVADSRKIMIHQNSAASSFTFDRIEQSQNKFDNLINWSMDRNKSVEQLSMSVFCKLIVAQNFSRGDSYHLMETMGKKLITEGVSFELITKFYTPRQEMCMSGEVHRQKRQSYDLFHEESTQLSGGINKKIRFISDLKQYVNDIKSLSQNICRFWLLTPIGEFGVGMVWSSAKKQSYVHAIEQLVNDYLLYRDVKPKKNLNIKIAISTVCQTPQQNNLQNCKIVLENSLLIRNEIMKFAMNQKNSIHPFSHDQKENEDHILKEQSNNKQKSDEKRSRKPSKVQFQQKPVRIPNVPPKIRQFSDSGTSQSEQESTLVKNILMKTKKQKAVDISETGIASILAENMNLKWQLTTKQKQFELQSQKFVQKMNKKMEAMREERSYVIQESARLRKDNEALLTQITSLKLEYQSILKTRCDYEKLMEQKVKITQITAQGASQLKIKQLSQQVKLLQELKQNLEAQITNMKLSLEDGRKRNRDKLEEVSAQINQYKEFCEELKAAYDDLERQSRLDQDRCQNLQKRCKKYQQTLSELMQIKIGSPAVNLDEVTSSKISVLMEEPLVAELESRKKIESESRSKIRKWEERAQSFSGSGTQSRKIEMKKSKGRNKSKRGEIVQEKKEGEQQILYERQVTFADSQSKFQ